MHHGQHVAHILGWAPTASLGVLSLVLPEPLNLTTFIMAMGAGLAGAYVIWLSKVTPARIAAEKEYDAAHRETNMAKLEEAHAQLEEANRRDAERRAEIKENCQRIADLESDRNIERQHAEKLRCDIEALGILLLKVGKMIGDEDREPKP